MSKLQANAPVGESNLDEPKRGKGISLATGNYDRRALFEALVPPIERNPEGARLTDLTILGVYLRYLEKYVKMKPGWNASERAFLLYLVDPKAPENTLPGSMRKQWTGDTLGTAFERIERTFGVLIFERAYIDGSGETLPLSGGFIRAGVVNRKTERFTPAGLAIGRWGLIVRSLLDLPGRIGDKFEHLTYLEAFQSRFADEVSALHTRVEAEFDEVVAVEKLKAARRADERKENIVANEMQDHWEDVHYHPDRHEEPRLDATISIEVRTGGRGTKKASHMGPK